MADNIVLIQSDLVGYNLAAKSMSIGAQTVKVVRHLLVDPSGNDITPVGAADLPAINWSVKRNLSLQSTTGLLVLAAPGTLYGYSIASLASVDTWLRFYNKVAAPVPTDNALIVAGPFLIPAGQPWSERFEGGIVCAAGIGARASTGPTETDNGDPGASKLIINVYYKAAA